MTIEDNRLIYCLLVATIEQKECTGQMRNKTLLSRTVRLFGTARDTKLAQQESRKYPKWFSSLYVLVQGIRTAS